MSVCGAGPPSVRPPGLGWMKGGGGGTHSGVVGRPSSVLRPSRSQRGAELQLRKAEEGEKEEEQQKNPPSPPPPPTPRPSRVGRKSPKGGGKFVGFCGVRKI